MSEARVQHQIPAGDAVSAERTSGHLQISSFIDQNRGGVSTELAGIKFHRCSTANNADDNSGAVDESNILKRAIATLHLRAVQCLQTPAAGRKITAIKCATGQAIILQAASGAGRGEGGRLRAE